MDIELPTKDQIIASLRPENYMGHGIGFAGYIVDGRPDLVLRAPKEWQNYKINLNELCFKPVQDPFEGRNFGQAIATQGLISIHRRQNGVSPCLYLHKRGLCFAPRFSSGLQDQFADAQIPPMVPLADFPLDLVVQESLRRMHFMLNVLKELPVQAFKTSLDKILFLKERGYGIDAAMNNTLIDHNAQTIGFIDLDRSNQAFEPTDFYNIFQRAMDFNLNNILARLGADDHADLLKIYDDVMRGVFLKFLLALEQTPSREWNLDGIGNWRIIMKLAGYDNEEAEILMQRCYAFKARCDQMHPDEPGVLACG